MIDMIPIENMDVLGPFAVLFGMIFYLVTLLGNMTYAWICEWMPKKSMLTTEQDDWLKGLFDMHNVMDDATGQPRWWNHPASYEAQQRMVSLLQSMQHNMSTQSEYIAAANKRDQKNFEEMFKLLRKNEEFDRKHAADVAGNLAVLLERTNHGR
jgi:hypothetical protein